MVVPDKGVNVLVQKLKILQRKRRERGVGRGVWRWRWKEWCQEEGEGQREVDYMARAIFLIQN